MDNNEIERAHNLLLGTAEIMAQFEQNSSHIVRSLQGKLDKSPCDQRGIITDMVRSEIMREMSVSVAGYVKDVENVRSQMVNQVWEFDSYLNRVNDESKKISSRLVLVVSISMAVLVIGELMLFFLYSMLIEQERQGADMVGHINRANIVRCGDELCTKTGKGVEDGYRVIQRRQRKASRYF